MQTINNTLRFVRANGSQKMFPSLPTMENMTKHRQEIMSPQQCFLVCPGLKVKLSRSSDEALKSAISGGKIIES